MKRYRVVAPTTFEVRAETAKQAVAILKSMQNIHVSRFRTQAEIWMGLIYDPDSVEEVPE